MALTIELPSDIEAALRQRVADLDRAATESLVVELYRQRQLTHAQVARALGLSRGDVDRLLRRHGVTLEMSADEVRRDERPMHFARCDPDADRS